MTLLVITPKTEYAPEYLTAPAITAPLGGCTEANHAKFYAQVEPRSGNYRLVPHGSTVFEELYDILVVKFPYLTFEVEFHDGTLTIVLDPEEQTTYWQDYVKPYVHLHERGIMSLVTFSYWGDLLIIPDYYYETTYPWY